MSENTTEINVNALQGRLNLAFSKDGSRLFTGGTDYMVHMVNLDEHPTMDGEPLISDNDLEEILTCMECCGDSLLVGTSNSVVHRFRKDTPEHLGSVGSVNGVPVQCIAIDPKGKKVAIGSQDPAIRIIDLEDLDYVRAMEGHPGGVRKVSWHPSLPILLACGANGVLTVWDLSGDQPQTQKKLDGIIPAVKDVDSMEYLHDCSGVWHPSGEYFVVITKSHEIVTISYPALIKTGWFMHKNITGTPTAIAMSINGAYIATATGRHLCVWSTDSKTLVAQHTTKNENLITQIAFSPRDNALAWTDYHGFLTQWRNPVPSSKPSPVQVTGAKSASQPDDDVEFDDMTDGLALDWDALVAKIPSASNDDETDTGVEEAEPNYVVNVTEPQPPFQPGATPMDNKKRYLAYNTIGVIEVTDQAEHYIINIEFFDRSTRRGLHFTSALKYDMGYLGERGAVFACPPEQTHTAQVIYKPYGTWSSQTDWKYDLQRQGVRVLGIAAGSVAPASSLRESIDGDLQGYGNVVIATDEGDLTFLSGTGRERRIMGLGADFISMVAGPEWVFVVHRAGGTTMDGSQNLSYSMINFDDFTVRQRDYLPVPKDHVLKWIGITGEGAPAIYDSSGRIHVLTKHRIPHHASWARIMDTSLLERHQGKDESYWPVGIEGNTFMCLILKGRQDYPGFPRPLIQELPISMPFRSEDPKEEQIEREMLLRDMALDALDEELTNEDIVSKERAMDKEFIQLIQAACKNDNVPRAIELLKLLHNKASIDAAAKIADYYHLAGFKEKVLRFKEIREETEDRLEVAREKRRRWNKSEAPARRLPEVGDGLGRAKPFQDFGPPPAIARPGLARAQPSVERSKYERDEAAPWDEESTQEDEKMREPEVKRKRTPEMEEEDVSMPPPPPKQPKANPFARKHPQETTRNPFSRRTDSNKILQKSESFFEKVDAAESVSAKPKRTLKGKDKEKEGGPRQTTLFGMLPKQNGVKKTASKRATNGEEDSQMTDVPMSDAQDSDVTMVATQQATDWEETQPAEEDSQF